MLAICGTATAIFAYHASLNSNEISRRSFENAEQSAQPIITGYIEADTLIINIQKEYCGINFVNATPVITFMEGVVNEKSLDSMKRAVFAYKSKRFGSSCLTDETNNIKCFNAEFKHFTNLLNKQLYSNNDQTNYSFRNIHSAYLFTISYNDIYNKRQIQHFIVNSRSRQHQISDTLFKERFANTEYLTMADTSAEGFNKILSKLRMVEEKSSKANSF